MKNKLEREAISAGDVGLAASALAFGTDADELCEGFTAAMWASEFGEAKCLQKVLEHGCDLNARCWGSAECLNLRLLRALI